MVKPNVQPNNATTRKIIVPRPPLSAKGPATVTAGPRPPVKRVLPGA
jgi:hypothetical protein